MKEEKSRIHTRISPETERKMELAMPNANCQSRNEFVERAICFYSDYITSKEVTNFLAPILVSTLRTTIQGSEDRISRLMFKQTVELSMMMNVLAAGLEIASLTVTRPKGCVSMPSARQSRNISPGWWM